MDELERLQHERFTEYDDEYYEKVSHEIWIEYFIESYLGDELEKELSETQIEKLSDLFQEHVADYAQGKKIPLTTKEIKSWLPEWVGQLDEKHQKTIIQAYNQGRLEKKKEVLYNTPKDRINEDDDLPF